MIALWYTSWVGSHLHSCLADLDGQSGKVLPLRIRMSSPRRSWFKPNPVGRLCHTSWQFVKSGGTVGRCVFAVSVCVAVLNELFAMFYRPNGRGAPLAVPCKMFFAYSLMLKRRRISCSVQQFLRCHPSRKAYILLHVLASCFWIDRPLQVTNIRC